MDPRYRFLTSGIPWTQRMPSRDVNAATRLAEASWRRDKIIHCVQKCTSNSSFKSNIYVCETLAPSASTKIKMTRFRIKVNVTRLVTVIRVSFERCH